MKRVALFVLIVLTPVISFAAAVDNRCPKGYIWSDSQKRCVTAPPEEKEGACTKSAKPWILSCSTNKKPMPIDKIYQSGYYIDRYSNGFFFIKKRGALCEQECSALKQPKASPAPETLAPTK